FKQDQNKKAAKKTKAAEPKAKSFKRFEISYESMWLRGKYFEEASFSVPGTTAWMEQTYKNRMSMQMDVYKGAFYFIPKTYIEGSFGQGNLTKRRPGDVNSNSSIGALTFWIPVDLTAKDATIWNADLCQNIYTHKTTGTAVDIFAGYSQYKDEVHLNLDTPTLKLNVLSAKHSYSGAHFGLKLKAPFTLPKMPKNPFTFKASASYTPDLILRGEDMTFLIVFQPDFSYKGKGSAVEAHTGLAFQITSFLSIEGSYNYYEYKMHKGTYDNLATTVTGPLVSIDSDIKKNKTILHGPSVSVKLIF
ncbi:MAG: hypothetical protein PHH69_06550, partial [Candidatus Omnitrophica bacterium]|nr:hypothetical protein [Candidatus Omnitrophota bacterium]MDD5611167.1 hypothetical protein [Candidatus Omnitrophota bacterium]